MFTAGPPPILPALEFPDLEEARCSSLERALLASTWIVRQQITAEEEDTIYLDQAHAKQYQNISMKNPKTYQMCSSSNECFRNLAL